MGQYAHGVHHTLGEIRFPDHPLMRDVKSFDGGPESHRAERIQVHEHAQVIAYWDDGLPLVATMRKGKGRVTALNFHVVPDSVLSNSWLDDTDGAKMLQNAVKYRDVVTLS